MPRKANTGMNVQDGPLASRFVIPGATGTDLKEIVDEQFRSNIHARHDYVWDFTGRVPTFSIDIPLFSNNATTLEINSVPVANTEFARGNAVVSRAGRLIAASFIGEDALAANDTNYLTFAVTNKQAGSGSVAMLAATDPNTTKSTGGAAVAALTERTLTISGTAAALQVVPGDVLMARATVAGTAANKVDNPVIRLTFACLPEDLGTYISRTAGSPLVAPVAATRNGAAIAQLEATSEAQIVGIDWNDEVCIPATKRPYFCARVKISGVAANTRFVFGLASARNATFDTTTNNAWFRVEGNDLSLLAEVDDDTTNTDDQDTTIDLVADTYVWLEVDMFDVGNIRFRVDGHEKLKIAGAAFAVTHLLQPVLWNQKASGTTVGSFTCDYLRVSWDRVH